VKVELAECTRRCLQGLYNTVKRSRAFPCIRRDKIRIQKRVGRSLLVLENRSWVYP
jgi:hypothetical protein